MIHASTLFVPLLILLCQHLRCTKGYLKKSFGSTPRRIGWMAKATQSHSSSGTPAAPLAAEVSPSSYHDTRKTDEGPPLPSLGTPICEYHTVDIPTTQQGTLPRQAISVEDLTPTIQSMLQRCGMQQGLVTCMSRHTTTAITINERESRLAQDMQDFFLQLVLPDERSSSDAKKTGIRYKHNDIDQRPDSDEEAQRCRDNGWDIDNPAELQKWRDQEPINAHSHLLSMLLGSSESIPVVDGKMVIGQWQSILLVDLDGPRNRTVGVQFLGYR